MAWDPSGERLAVIFTSKVIIFLKLTLNDKLYTQLTTEILPSKI